MGRVLVVLRSLRPDLLLRELVRKVAQRLLLVRQRKRRPHTHGVLHDGHDRPLASID